MYWQARSHFELLKCRTRFFLLFFLQHLDNLCQNQRTKSSSAAQTGGNIIRVSGALLILDWETARVEYHLNHSNSDSALKAGWMWRQWSECNRTVCSTSHFSPSLFYITCFLVLHLFLCTWMLAGACVGVLMLFWNFCIPPYSVDRLLGCTSALVKSLLRAFPHSLRTLQTIRDC